MADLSEVAGMADAWPGISAGTRSGMSSCYRAVMRQRDGTPPAGCPLVRFAGSLGDWYSGMPGDLSTARSTTRAVPAARQPGKP